MEVSESIYVKSHVARDLLQTAGGFADVPKAIWEYIVNGLEYVDQGVSPIVHVKVDKRSKKIEVRDNGRGMDLEGIRNYFILHGENIDRKAGRQGRGRFGTGKSAAFGIAEVLRVTSVQNGHKCIAELRKRDVENHPTGDQIPVQLLTSGEATIEANGTLIEIEGVTKYAVDLKYVRDFINRQLRTCRRGSRVLLNGEECSCPVPPILDERVFRSDSDSLMGAVELFIFRTSEYLELTRGGIAISCNGVLHEVVPVDSNRYVFGHVDVPQIDLDKSEIPPFDATRSLKLNPNNHLVRAIHKFIDVHVRRVCEEYKEADKERRKNEESKRLDSLASKVSKALNRHFESLRNRPTRTLPLTPEGIDRPQYVSGTTRGTVLSGGGNIPATLAVQQRYVGSGESKWNGTAIGGTIDGTMESVLVPAQDGDERGGLPLANATTVTTTCGFCVKYDNAGPDAERAKYVSDQRAIIINRDHPQVAAAYSSTSLSEYFQRLVNEIVFITYAIGLCTEMANEGKIVDPLQAVDEIQETINWLSRHSFE